MQYRKPPARGSQTNSGQDIGHKPNLVDELHKEMVSKQPEEYDEFADISQNEKPTSSIRTGTLKNSLRGNFVRASSLLSVPSVSKKLVVGSFFAVVAVLIVATIATGGDGSQVATNPEVRSQNGSVAPSFDLAKPDDVSVDTDVFFDPEVGVASYQDEIDGVTVAISQQPLTTDQLNNKDTELLSIADSLQAGTKFQTKYGDVYLADPDSEQTANTQVALFMTDQLLIFMRTDGSLISIDSWAEYINQTSG